MSETGRYSRRGPCLRVFSGEEFFLVSCEETTPRYNRDKTAFCWLSSKGLASQNSKRIAMRGTLFSYRLLFFFFFHLTYSRWTSSLPSCLWSRRIFPSLPGSRLTIFLSRCKFSTLTTRQPMVEFYLLTFPRFPLRKKEHKSYFGKNRTHDFRTSRCAAYLLDHSGDELLIKSPEVHYTIHHTFLSIVSKQRCRAALYIQYTVPYTLYILVYCLQAPLYGISTLHYKLYTMQ